MEEGLVACNVLVLELGEMQQLSKLLGPKACLEGISTTLVAPSAFDFA